MAGLAAVLICLILLFVPTSRDSEFLGRTCGSVVNRTSDAAPCDSAINTRLTISLVIGAVGVAAFFGASQVNKREDE